MSDKDKTSDLEARVAEIIQQATFDDHSWGHCEYYTSQIVKLLDEREVEGWVVDVQCQNCITKVDHIKRIVFEFTRHCIPCNGTGFTQRPAKQSEVNSGEGRKEG